MPLLWRSVPSTHIGRLILPIAPVLGNPIPLPVSVGIYVQMHIPTQRHTIIDKRNKFRDTLHTKEMKGSDRWCLEPEWH